MLEKLDDAVRQAEDYGGANDPRLVLLLQQYGELLIVNSREQREMTKKLAQVSLDDLRLTSSPRTAKKDRLKTGYSYSSYSELSKGNSRDSASQSVSSDAQMKSSMETADADMAEASYGRSLLGDDVSRGLAMLNRAVQITKAINRPGSEAELDARAIFIRYQVMQGRYEKEDALRELHRLYTVVSRAAGDASCPALALQALTVQTPPCGAPSEATAQASRPASEAPLQEPLKLKLLTGLFNNL
ncbi:hypothetical protein FHG87_007373 [Trinorchestia longiramus]|nr:hypothetical protein FHG87_007373 [Trinorchestia longiramus]